MIRDLIYCKDSNIFFGNTVECKKGEQRRPAKHLSVVQELISLSPDNDNSTTSEVKLSRARRTPEIKHSHFPRIQKMLTKVSKCSSAAPGRGVAVINTSHHEQLFGHRGGHDASTTGSRDETHQNRSAATGDLAGHGVGLADFVTPITSPDGDD